jgi:hypothetical protein
VLEFSAQLPEVKLVPYAVSSLQPDLPLLRRLQRLHEEYAKYLASSVRIMVLRRSDSVPSAGAH